MEQLCRLHWPTIYWEARRSGFDTAEAEDLTQDFFSGLFRRKSLAGYTPAKGNLRTFLLSSFRHFAIDHRRKASAKKRGGDFEFVPYEEEIGNPTDSRDGGNSSESDLAWAGGILQRATKHLEAYYERAGKGDLLDAIKPFLDASGNETPDYASLAARLDLSEPGVRSAVFRMRRRFQSFVLAVVEEESGGQDLSNPG